MNALHSLFGAKAKALAGNVGGQARHQEVGTPDCLVEPIQETLGLFFDPCANPDRPLYGCYDQRTLDPSFQALQTYLAENKATLTAKEIAEGKKVLKQAYIAGANADSWTHKGPLFCNPPFEVLQPWMEACQAHGEKNPTILLCPVRTQRTWWFPALRGAEVVFLSYAIKFHGFDQAFPAGLCLATWNCTLPSLGKLETRRLSL